MASARSCVPRLSADVFVRIKRDYLVGDGRAPTITRKTSEQKHLRGIPNRTLLLHSRSTLHIISCTMRTPSKADRGGINERATCDDKDRLRRHRWSVQNIVHNPGAKRKQTERPQNGRPWLSSVDSDYNMRARSDFNVVVVVCVFVKRTPVGSGGQNRRMLFCRPDRRRSW